MTPPLRFTTMRIGIAVVHASGQRFELDIRVLLGSDGSYRVLSGSLSAPLPTLQAAIAQAESPEPRSPGVTWEVRWRDDVATLGPDEQRCPTCGAPSAISSRYPRLLCPACVLEATDAQGRPLTFANIDMSGGFQARYADDGTVYRGHECFVRGVRCHADEHRFGGIVVQPVAQK